MVKGALVNGSIPCLLDKPEISTGHHTTYKQQRNRAMIENRQVIGEVKEYAHDGYEPTDDEFFDWCFKYKNGTEAFTTIFENADDNDFIGIGCALLMLCLPRSKEGVMSEANCRDLIASDQLRKSIMPILRKYYYEDCCAWFDNQEAE
jgi:hypothetical protein